MYQSVGTNMAEAIAECLGVPLIRRYWLFLSCKVLSQVKLGFLVCLLNMIGPTHIRELKGKPVILDLDYTGTAESKQNDEVEDLFEILKEAREKWEFTGVSSGAIASTYQKLRVEDW